MIHKNKKNCLEYLAIKEAVKYWQHWLIGSKFLAFSNNKQLENINIKARTDEKLADILFFTINPEIDNAEVDSLSKNPVLYLLENNEEILKKGCKKIKNKTKYSIKLNESDEEKWNVVH